MESSSRGPGRVVAGRCWWAVLLTASLLLVPGCGGCGGCSRTLPQTPEELEKERAELQKKLKEKEKKPDFEIDRLVAQPFETKPDRPNEPKPDRCWCKPGHWTSVNLPAKANNDNFNGELEVAAVESGGNVGGLRGMPFALGGSRSAYLTKGQLKSLESLVFLPPVGEEVRVHTRIADRLSGRTAIEATHPIARMPAYQYHFVVLARFPERYTFLSQLDSFKYPMDFAMSRPTNAFYRPVLLPGDRAVSLPSHSLYWTSIAALLWDETDPAMLRPEQQTALLDWLHWGGQLIISGPDTLDGLKSSFLAPYLPATSAGVRKLAVEDLKPLSDAWTPAWQPVPTSPAIRASPLIPSQPWPGVKLEKQAEGRFLPGTGELLAERRIGRGRIVVSAFSLSGRDLLAWQGIDPLMNACLLGRPPRRFQPVSGWPEQLQVLWADTAGPAAPRPAPVNPYFPVPGMPGAVQPTPLEPFANIDPQQLDPRRTCRLWYFSRDAGRTGGAGPSAATSIQPTQPAGLATMWQPPAQTAPDPWFAIVTEAQENQAVGCGVAGWTDFNPVANAARDALQDAAKVEIPEATFVLWVVGGYLVVLVPLNWLFFRLIGRVEWAWVAAPLIAVVCTVVVIRLARLDIGFERSANEIAVVELQGGHSRAHVARFNALYTALYTDYTISSDDPGAQILPFPTVSKPSDFQLRLGDRITRLRYRHGTETTALDGFFVPSNSTKFLHSEQIADLGGPIHLQEAADGGLHLQNRTDYTLRGAGVLWKKDARADGELEAAWLDDIGPGSMAPLRFIPVSESERKALWKDQRERSPLTMDTSGTKRGGQLNLRALLDLAQQTELLPGEIRLVGWLDELIPGQQIEPAARRTQQAAVVVAHLRYGPGPDPRPDAIPRLAVDAKARVLTPNDLKEDAKPSSNKQRTTDNRQRTTDNAPPLPSRKSP